MRIIKTILNILAADILSLFIALPLAGSDNPLVRAISAICTSGIMICLLGSFGMGCAEKDMKNERITGKRTPAAVPVSMGAAALVIPLASWLTLRITSGGGVDFYRWHKLINGWFLQIYNMINTDASSAALTSGQIWGMLPLALAPAAVLIAAYFLVYLGVLNAEKKQI